MKNIVFDLGRVLLDYQPLAWLKKKNYTHYNELFDAQFKKNVATRSLNLA